MLVQQLSVNEASPGAMAPGELERDPPPGAKKNGPKDWSCQYCDDDLEMNACLQMSHWLGGLPVGNLTFVLDQNLDYQFDRQKSIEPIATTTTNWQSWRHGCCDGRTKAAKMVQERDKIKMMNMIQKK